jgi:cation diffusion facilitator CzcD-associated flavoprotein CzcO
MNDPRRHVIIVGSGFGGLGMAIKLREKGFDSFTVLERAGDVGGTWRDNTYPGAACDIQSHLYSFSFEPNPRWSRMYAEQGEILEYLRHCTNKYGVRPSIRFGTEVTGATWHDARGLWEVRTNKGDTLWARAIVSATGGLSRPAYPDIPGLSTFGGKSFHSAAWDHDYDLTGKRVAVIGTGASSIQIVPEVAKIAAKLTVLQRTPPWIMPKEDRAIGAAEKLLYARFPFVQDLYRKGIFAKLDLRGVGFVLNRKILTLGEGLARKHLKTQVPDPVLRQKLGPSYRMGCKRILLSNDYYPALGRPNVALETTPIAGVSTRGVVLDDGRTIDLDAIICSTGFQAADAVAPFEVRGRDGLLLNDAWRDGAEAYLGTTVAGFPNLFLIVGPNTGLGHNSMVHIIESQIAYVAKALDVMFAENLSRMEVRPERQKAYNDEIHPRLSRAVWGSGGCVSWYRAKNGKNTTLWPGFASEFRLRLRRFDTENYVMERDQLAATAFASAVNAPSTASSA